MVEKSFNMIVQETREKLMQVLVDSKIPATAAEMVLRETLQKVSLQTEQILQQERLQYEQLVQEENKKKEVNNHDTKSTRK